MKSVKFYFSLLLSAVMLTVAVPAMAQNDEPTAPEAATEQVEPAVVAEAEAPVVEVAEAEAVAAHVAKSTEGRENTDIDAEFSVGKAIGDFVSQSGFKGFVETDKNGVEGWRYGVMILISFLLLYLAIVKKFEPLLLMPIAFGMLLTNLPGAGMFHSELFAGGHVHWEDFALGSGVGLLDYLYLGV